MRERIIVLRDRLHEVSCDLALFYLEEVEKELRRFVEEERRQELFYKFITFLKELLDIRQSLSSIIHTLKEQRVGDEDC
jgi:hypothetical protein